VAGTGAIGRAAGTAEPKAPKLWTLEGELKVHSKYLYRYYVVLSNESGQRCALFGSDHSRDPVKLARLQFPARVRVRGVLGTEHHAGGTKENPSPFSETWILYMDVHEVEALK